MGGVRHKGGGGVSVDWYAMVSATWVPTERERRLSAATLLITDLSVSVGQLIDRFVGTSANHEVQVLTSLYQRSQQRPGEMMELTGLTRPGVANLVARLEHLELVERTSGVSDRRTTLTSLTQAGRKRMVQLERSLDEYFAQNAEQTAEILRVLKCDGRRRPRVRGVEDSALSIVGRLSAAGAALMQSLDERARPLQARQRNAICALMDHGELRAGQLAALLGLSSGGLTYLTDQLHADGLIERHHGHPDDRRAVVIRLSDDGRVLGRLMCSALEAVAPQLCEAFWLMTLPAA